MKHRPMLIEMCTEESGYEKVAFSLHTRQSDNLVTRFLWHVVIFIYLNVFSYSLKDLMVEMSSI